LANITDWVNLDADDVVLQSDLTPGPSPKERGEETRPFITSDFETWKKLKPFARENRQNNTPAENLLWQNVRNRNINNDKFRRQHVIGGFIVDFVCLEKNLVIEIDGGYHSDEDQKKYDDLRTEYLKENGFTELRFTTEQIQKSLSESLAKIKEALRQSSPLPGRGVRGEVFYRRETNTMPGYAGSSWYFLRYMDPHNDKEFADRKATDYWNQVDVYVGGTEHAVGHLLYSRMWTKVLYDLGLIGFDEPFKKLVNQGMIQGSSRFVYILISKQIEPGYQVVHEKKYSFEPIIVSSKYYLELREGRFDPEKIFTSVYKNISDAELPYYSHSLYELHVDVNLVDGIELDIKAFRNSKPEYMNAVFILEDGKVLSPGEDLGEVSSKYICGVEVEKMSKSKYNTVNPNDLIDKYGADTFRMYEMFLGPVEASKPWDTKGIEGVHRFLKKLWRLFYDDAAPLSRGRGAGGEALWNEQKATEAELKVLHKAIKKIEEDTEKFSYNTAVSAFMVCVNELTDLKCHKKEILEPLLILLTPYAPHIAEELYHALGNTTTILDAAYPKLEIKYLIESEKEYPVSINGKMRTTINISLGASQDEVEKIALNNEVIQKWIEGKQPKKIIFVKNKMINIVV
jgi:leucyl-tRNA synthetase